VNRPRKAGERVTTDEGWVMEWDGSTWAPVCPKDNVPMAARDRGGWLYCTVCRTRVDKFDLEVPK
jgi:hypothetical protein